MFTIYATPHGAIGSYRTAEDALTAMHYLPYRIRKHAKVIYERSIAR